MRSISSFRRRSRRLGLAAGSIRSSFGAGALPRARLCRRAASAAFFALTLRIDLRLLPGSRCGFFALAFLLQLSLAAGRIRRLFALTLGLDLGLPTGSLCGHFATLLCLALDLPLGGVRGLPPAQLDQGGEPPGPGIGTRWCSAGRRNVRARQTHRRRHRNTIRRDVGGTMASHRDDEGRSEAIRRGSSACLGPAPAANAPHLDLGLRRLSEQHQPQLRDGLRRPRA